MIPVLRDFYTPSTLNAHLLMRLTPSHQTPLRITRKRLGRRASLRPERLDIRKKKKKKKKVSRTRPYIKRCRIYPDGPKSSRNSEQCWLRALFEPIPRYFAPPCNRIVLINFLSSNLFSSSSFIRRFTNFFVEMVSSS